MLKIKSYSMQWVLIPQWLQWQRNTMNFDSVQSRAGQAPFILWGDCVSVCSPGSSCGAVCCGAKSHCWEPQWKESMVHIPATWDSSVSVILHSSIDTGARNREGWRPNRGWWWKGSCRGKPEDANRLHGPALHLWDPPPTPIIKPSFLLINWSSKSNSLNWLIIIIITIIVIIIILNGLNLK